MTEGTRMTKGLRLRLRRRPSGEKAEPPVPPSQFTPIQPRDGRAETGPVEDHADMAVATKNLTDAISEVMAIQGAMAVALVDSSSGMVMDKQGGGTWLDLDVAAEGNSEVVRAKLRVKEALGVTDDLEDILITLTTQYHLIRILGSDKNLFFYVVLNRQTANLAMARRSLQKIEDGLVV